MTQSKLGSKLINNSYLGVYKIFKVLEQLEYTTYNEVKSKKDIPKFIYSLYDQLKKEFGVDNDTDLQNELNSDPKIQHGIKTILNSYFDSALGIKSDIKNGDLLDSVFIDVICKGFEYKSHLHYKFAGIYTYQDFELPKMDPQRFINILNDNLKEIYIEKEEIDKRLTQDFGLDDKIDNIKLLKKYSKISQLGFVLNTCHNYSPGQHWVAMCMQLLQTQSKKRHFRLFYYDSQMTSTQQNGIGFQTEPLDCECYPECPAQYRHYTPKVREWLQKLSQTLDKNKISYSSTNDNIIKVHFNKQNTQDDDFSCGYHSILFNYLMSVNGEALDTIQSRLKTKSNLDSIISRFRKLLVRTSTSDQQEDNEQNDNEQEQQQITQEGGVREKTHETQRLLKVYL